MTALSISRTRFAVGLPRCGVGILQAWRRVLRVEDLHGSRTAISEVRRTASPQVRLTTTK